MFYLTEPVWSLHLSGTSSCRISVRGRILKSGQLLVNKWMVWKWTGFQHKGFTVYDITQYITGRRMWAGLVNSLSMLLQIHYQVTITGTVSTENRSRGLRLKLEETETYYTIHLWDSRRATRNYILFLVDYDNYKRKNTSLTPLRFFFNHATSRKQWIVT